MFNYSRSQIGLALMFLIKQDTLWCIFTLEEMELNEFNIDFEF